MSGLQELRAHDEDMSYLAPELAAILKDADGLKRRQAGNPRALEHLGGIMKDLFLDWQRFNGAAPPRHRVPALDALLRDPSSTLDDVVAFIREI